MFSNGSLQQIAGGRPQVGIFLRIACDDTVRIWSGNGLIDVGPDAVEPVAVKYQGFGVLRGLPTVSQLINGQSDRVDFTLSGLDVKIATATDAAASTLVFREVRMGVTTFDKNWAPYDPVAWLWRGVADVPSTQIQRDAAGNETATVGISVGTANTGRRRPSLVYYTDVDQKRRSATDRFCERVRIYSEGTVQTWPRYTDN